MLARAPECSGHLPPRTGVVRIRESAALQIRATRLSRSAQTAEELLEPRVASEFTPVRVVGDPGEVGHRAVEGFLESVKSLVASARPAYAQAML